MHIQFPISLFRQLLNYLAQVKKARIYILPLTNHHLCLIQTLINPPPLPFPLHNRRISQSFTSSQINKIQHTPYSNPRLLRVGIIYCYIHFKYSMRSGTMVIHRSRRILTITFP